jgi:hypothetical protein
VLNISEFLAVNVISKELTSIWGTTPSKRMTPSKTPSKKIQKITLKNNNW